MAIDAQHHSTYGEKMAARAAADAQSGAAVQAGAASDAAAAAGDDGTFPLAVLQQAVPPDGVDASRREEFLADAAFEALFGMGKAAFAALPKWKRTAAKKQHKLF